MTMLKITGALMIILTGIFAGIYAGAVKRRKAEFIRQYIIFLTRAETMISYSSSSISTILDNICLEGSMEEVLKVFRKGLDEGNNINSAWKNALIYARQKNLIDEQDMELLQMFSKDFGTCAAEEEKGKIVVCRSLAQQRLDEMLPETKEKVKLYRIIGTFSGALLAVMII